MKYGYVYVNPCSFQDFHGKFYIENADHLTLMYLKLQPRILTLNNTNIRYVIEFSVTNEINQVFPLDFGNNDLINIHNTYS